MGVSEAMVWLTPIALSRVCAAGLCTILFSRMRFEYEAEIATHYGVGGSDDRLLSFRHVCGK